MQLEARGMMAPGATRGLARPTVAARSRARVVRVAAYRDARQLRDIQTARMKHILSTYNKAHSFFPKVKFVLQHNSRLGEVWKLSGSCAELGKWVPEISPSLKWSDGGVWSAEVSLPPGTYTFKAMLRTADGSYVWEGGENRHLVVPVKERAGSYVLQYQIDVRTEGVESLPLSSGKYGAMAGQGGGQYDRSRQQQGAPVNGRAMVGAY